MTRITIVFFVFALTLSAQNNFQPPSWGLSQSEEQHLSQQISDGEFQLQIARRAYSPQHPEIKNLEKLLSQYRGRLEQVRAQHRQETQPHVESQTGPVVGHPVSGKELRRTKQTLMEGTEVNRTDTSYFYRDAAGRMRAESPKKVEIFDPVSHFSYDLNPEATTYRRQSISGNVAYVSLAAFGNSSETHISSDAAHASQAPGGATVTDDLGRQMVNGVMAKGSRVTITIPAGAFGNSREIKVVNERWYSDDLQILVKSINTDPRFGVNEYELTDIKQTAPDAALFAPPSGYTMQPWESRQ